MRAFRGEDCGVNTMRQNRFGARYVLYGPSQETPIGRAHAWRHNQKSARHLRCDMRR